MRTHHFVLVLAPFAAGLAVGCGSRSGWNQQSDCLTDGTCECRTREDCPAGQDCFNGRCRAALDPDTPLLGFGEPCELDDQCASGYCIPARDAKKWVCTQTCTGTCPQDWDCKVRPGQPPVSLCVQSSDWLCADCSVDQHCNAAFGDACLSLGGLESCGRDCHYAACPEGYECQSLTVRGLETKQCVPTTGTCACTEDNAGLKRGCENTNSFGTCRGTSVCQPDGTWSSCSASVPALESCNGLDDDCDGLLDADDPDIDISELPEASIYPACVTGAGHACQGRWTCQKDAAGDFAWNCTALDPREEMCDGLDNNCDGAIDEPFRDSEGLFVDVHHCGRCAIDCTQTVSNLATDSAGQVLEGAVSCEVREGEPVCVPSKCAPGYYAYPPEQPVLCNALPTPQCRACTTDSDCALSGDRCVQLESDSHRACLQSCGADSPYGCSGQTGVQGCCPDHSTCQDLNGQLLCVPDGGTCECDADHAGVTRSCIVTSSTGAECVGVQSCLVSSESIANWSECDASSTTGEVCDGQDNDCDSLVDEPFINQHGSGTYDTNEHCGACHHDCLAKWSPSIQHAIGGCIASSSVTPHCEIVACTGESVGGGGQCRLDRDCPSGWSCEPRFYQCTRACSGPSDCPGGLCHDGWCTIACTSDSACTSHFGSPSRCSGGVCRADYQFHNTDLEDTNGCECAAATGQTDEPDVYDSYPEAGSPYVDRNCDGVDGTKSAALYVWAGSQLSQGTIEHPYQTIYEAIASFDPSKHKHILVAEGYYQESVTLRPGVQLYGGYGPDFTERDITSHPTVIAAPEPDFSNPSHPRGTINAVGINGAQTVVAGFAIYGFDVNYKPAASQPGASTYAVFVKDSSSALVIANNLIFAGRAGDGGDGRAGTPGESGGAGASGRHSRECNNASCSGQSQPGGAGGVNSACNAPGNPGAAASGDVDPQGYEPWSTLNGIGGDNGTYSNEFNPQWSHLCKYDCMVGNDMNGRDARSGENGAPGMGGAGCNHPLGTVVAGEWKAGTASPGTRGTHGQGGGGGGAGGCVININSPSCTVGNRLGDLGATGGGGGAGGCAGQAGLAGGAGGASFGVFIGYSSNPSSTPRLFANIIHQGQGGAGGNGGYGGHGGVGGPGGTGGLGREPAWCAGDGGKGGRGGDGGSGGGAGGGCGGVAFAIGGNRISAAAYHQANRIVILGTTAGGSGGTGGPSPAGGSANGTSGVNGASGEIHVY